MLAKFTAMAMVNASAMPARAPRVPMIAPSNANVPRMVPRPIPKASRVPISRIRSLMAMSMVLVTERPTTATIITPRTMKMLR